MPSWSNRISRENDDSLPRNSATDGCSHSNPGGWATPTGTPDPAPPHPPPGRRGGVRPGGGRSEPADQSPWPESTVALPGALPTTRQDTAKARPTPRSNPHVTAPTERSVASADRLSATRCKRSNAPARPSVRPALPSVVPAAGRDYGQAARQHNRHRRGGCGPAALCAAFPLLLLDWWAQATRPSEDVVSKLPVAEVPRQSFSKLAALLPNQPMVAGQWSRCGSRVGRRWRSVPS
jgi:hypothetical protein